MRRFRLVVYTRFARHHNALRLVVNEYVDAAARLLGEDDVALLVTRDQAAAFASRRNVYVLPFDSGNAALSHLTTLVALPLLSIAFPRIHLLVPQIAFVGPIRGGFTAVVHDLIEWRVRSQAWTKLLARRVLYRSTFHFARRILCVSDATRRELLEFFPRYVDKCAVVHNGVDALARVEAKPVRELEGSRFAAVVGYVSEPQKNLLCVIDAFSALAAQRTEPDGGPPLRLAFAGPLGLRSDDVLRIARERLGGRFAYVGVVEDAQVKWLFENAALVVAASKAEGFSLTPAQALHHGGRVVASSIAPHREILGDAAVYFDPASSADCARAMAECLARGGERAAATLPTWGDLPERLKGALPVWPR